MAFQASAQSPQKCFDCLRDAPELPWHRCAPRECPRFCPPIYHQLVRGSLKCKLDILTIFFWVNVVFVILEHPTFEITQLLDDWHWATWRKRIKYLDCVGSTRLCQMLLSTENTQDMSQTADLPVPEGIRFKWGAKAKNQYNVFFCKKLNWSPTDQLAPLEEDERYPLSRASHDHVLRQGFAFVSFDVNLQDQLFCLCACLVEKGPSYLVCKIICY